MSRRHRRSSRRAPASTGGCRPASASAGRRGLHASHRRNPDAPFVDATIVSGNGGFSWRRGAFFGRAAIDAYYGARDGESNESFTGLDTAVGRRFGDNWSVSLGLRGGAQRFDDSIDVLDVNRLLYSVTLARRYANGVRMDVAGIGGSDNEREAGSPYGNSKLGARAAVYLPLDHASRMQASVGLLQSDFDGLFFGAEREDRQLTGALSMEFRDVFFDGLSISPRVRYVNNDSDVALYDYARTEFGIGLRWTHQ
ncbi:MAG: surface lipoprotein assembly modifier [Woeseiaceae bacterium]|nr:surface lipoprotein assembly modifier [Woeseiaceae bacterium]